MKMGLRAVIEKFFRMVAVPDWETKAWLKIFQNGSCSGLGN